MAAVVRPEGTTFGKNFRGGVMKKIKPEDAGVLLDYARETIDEIEGLVETLTASKKKRRFIVGTPQSKKGEKIELAIQVFDGLVRSSGDFVEMFNTFKQIRELDKELAEIYKELRLSADDLERYKARLERDSEVLKKLIELYNSKLENVLKILHALPNEGFLERKAELIDRALDAMDRLTELSLKLLST
jgi:vacuolar-type H+-ATPase subunit I/STV1